MKNILNITVNELLRNRLMLLIGIVICLYISQFVIAPLVLAQVPPASNNYKMLEYGFGAGGTASSSSNTYSLFGTLGQVDQGSPASNLYNIGAGLEYEIQASEAAKPSLTNPANLYNMLHLTVVRGGNDPVDYQYAIAISASDAAHFQYVQVDHTLGSTLNDNNWQSYAAWGGANGFNIVGLIPGTTYYARVTARQGRFFTQSSWSPTATAATIDPTLSFDINIGATDTPTSPPYILNIGNLSPGSVTTSSKKAWVDISSNATGGVFISINGTNNGLLSSTASQTINSQTADLTAQPSGYGAQSTNVGQTSGGPMEALSPYNSSVVTNNVGIIDSSKRYIYDSSQNPVTGGSVAFQLKAKASNTTPSAPDYTDTITVLATGSF